jgi:hypothetical protein
MGKTRATRGVAVSKRNWIWALMILLPSCLMAQDSSNQRTFQHSKAEIEKALKAAQPTSGRLPTLDGFATASSSPLSRFKRGYYESKVEITTSGARQSIVRITTKITAWYQGASGADSGYRSLASNGRLELDLLDRISDALSDNPTSSNNVSAGKPTAGPFPSSSSLISAPVPQFPALRGPGAASPTSTSPTNSSDNAANDKHLAALAGEAKNLDEILRNQSHPTNLVAVRKGGAPILSSPTEGAKLLFTAAAEDEFELLDENVSWVHVRISGLSRGWIRRANIEVPDDAPSKADSSETFRITKDQIASFPGDWEPLRGKTVKIVSVQAVGDALVGWRAKRDYAKKLFQDDYAALAASGGESGEVIIFDAQDGGMMAATLASVKQWRNGDLNDDAFWKQCFFDPPETFGAQTNQ